MNTFNKNNENNTPRGPLSIDDPRLTALALGELKDAALLAEAEKSPELSREIARIRRAAKALEGAFAEEAAEPVPLKKPVATAPAKAARIVRFPLLRPSVYMPLTGIAAMAVIAIGIFNYKGDSGKPLPTLTSEAPEKPVATIVTPQPPQISADGVATDKGTMPASTAGAEIAPSAAPGSVPTDAIWNEEFLKDTVGIESSSLLVYTTNAEDGGNAEAKKAPATDKGALTSPTIGAEVVQPAAPASAPGTEPVNQPFLKDVGATDSSSPLNYTSNTDVGGTYGAKNALATGKVLSVVPSTTGSTGKAPATSNAPGVTRQVATPAPAAEAVGTTETDEDVYILSPFEVTASGDAGYASTQTLAGTRRRGFNNPAYVNVGNGKIAISEEDFGNYRQSISNRTNSAIPYQPAPVDREQYDAIVENSFASPLAEPLSTFSIDVDTASYANVRRMLSYGTLPPAGAVRIEEMLNYFSYDYASPTEKSAPFAAHIAATSAPWAPEHQLVRIALKGYEVPWEARPASNLVFLVDVSGSMDSPDKLPLVKEGLKMLVERLDARDSVAIVTYAGYEELALPSTTANNKETILHAIDRLGAGGSTNGAGGIQLAYDQAKEHFLKDGLNRVILCTDGDFNVGVTSRSDLVDLIAEEAKSGVFLSIFSFGTGNLQDSTMEQLADKGNGNYGYVDSESEARRVFVRNISGNLITIAKDVKIQVEFNPSCVQAYRLIGYENRKLEAQDFNDDKKDAGEIGAGHSVTALYEVIPVGVKWEEPASVDALKYQKNPPDKAVSAPSPDEMLTVKVRFKAPDGDVSRKLEFPFAAKAVTAWDKADADTRFAAAVALFGMELRRSPNAGSGSLTMAKDLAAQALGAHPEDERIELLELIRKAEAIRKAQEVREKAGKSEGK